MDGGTIFAQGEGVSPSLPFHPLAELFPLLDGAEFATLVEDIRANGQNEPIVIHKGAILDGRNRYRACQAAGVEPWTTPFTGSDPVAYVISANLRRRHLNESQRAMVAARLANLGHGQRADQAAARPANLPVLDGEAPIPPPVAQSGAADMLNVSERSVRAARTVQSEAVPALAKTVEKGEVSVSAAATVAKLPPAVQEIVAAEPEQVAVVAKVVRTGNPEPLADLREAIRPTVQKAVERFVKEEKKRTEAAERGPPPSVPPFSGLPVGWTEWTGAIEELAGLEPDFPRFVRATPTLNADYLANARKVQPQLQAWIDALEAADV